MVHHPDFGGQAPPKILVLGRLMEIPSMRQLITLASRNAVQVEYASPGFLTPDEFEEEVKEKIKGCSALICRPTRGGSITERLISSGTRPFYVATLSKGVDHIEIGAKAEKADVRVINYKGDANAPAVAELTLNLAAALLRPFHLCAWATLQGSFDNAPFSSSRRLEGLTWAAVGSGAQVRSLLERVLGWGLKRFLIINERIDSHRFEECLKGVACLARIERNGDLSAFIGGAAGLEVLAITDIGSALPQADVVSLHLPLTRVYDEVGRPPTFKSFHVERLSQMKEGAVLINVSRGDLVDEQAVIAALKSRHLLGYGADVIGQEAERSGHPDDSIVWSTAMEEYEKTVDHSLRLNIVLTPHVGGTTVDALNGAAENVLGELLRLLGVEVGLSYEQSGSK